MFTHRNTNDPMCKAFEGTKGKIYSLSYIFNENIANVYCFDAAMNEQAQFSSVAGWQFFRNFLTSFQHQMEFHLRKSVPITTKL